jgi:LPXTG-motif cell wall-anchored protein
MTRYLRLVLALFVIALLSPMAARSVLANAGHRYEGPMIDAHAHPIQWSRDWMVNTYDLYRKAGVDMVIFFDGDGVLQAKGSRPKGIIPAFRFPDDGMNRTYTASDVETAINRGFTWIGEALLRHWGITNIPADSPAALKVYDMCAKHRVPITVHQDAAEYYGAYAELERALSYSPNCTFVFHGWWLGRGSLQTVNDLGMMMARHPNLYVEFAGELEYQANASVLEQTFLGGTSRDQFANPDGTIREEWRSFFEKYQDRIINGFDLFSQSAYKLEEIKKRVDYWRNLLGQMSSEAAEKIAHRNVEDLLAHRPSSTTLTAIATTTSYTRTTPYTYTTTVIATGTTSVSAGARTPTEPATTPLTSESSMIAALALIVIAAAAAFYLRKRRKQNRGHRSVFSSN